MYVWNVEEMIGKRLGKKENRSKKIKNKEY